MSLARHLAALALSLPATGCGALAFSGGDVSYSAEPIEFLHDFGTPGAATFPLVACSKNADCDGIPSEPAGLVRTCDPGSRTCVGALDVALYTTVTLSREAAFPELVWTRSVGSTVQVTGVREWTATNTLTVPSPPMKLYTAPEGTARPGDAATLLATPPTLAPMTRTQCGPGAAGTSATACDLHLVDEGKAALAGFAQAYRAPFNLILDLVVTLGPSDEVPGGLLDVYVQPVFLYQL